MKKDAQEQPKVLVKDMVNGLGIKVMDALRWELERWCRETGQLPAPLR